MRCRGVILCCTPCVMSIGKLDFPLPGRGGGGGSERIALSNAPLCAPRVVRIQQCLGADIAHKQPSHGPMGTQ